MDEGDLAKECFTEAEQEKLLSFSVAYENIVLPKMHALGGEKKLKKHVLEFSLNNLSCFDNPNWAFLFEKNLWY